MIQKVTREQVLNYAKVSKDQAGIHIDPESAAKAGFQRPVVHGMYVMGLAQSLYLIEHPEHWIVSYSMKFQQPLLIEEEVSFFYNKQQDCIEVSILAKENRSIAIGNFEVKEWLR